MVYKNSKKLNNNGFTLVELMVSIAILSIVLTLASGIIISALKYFEKQSAQIDLQNESQIITNYLSEASMEATAFELEMNTDPTTSLVSSVVLKLYDGDAVDNRRAIVYDAATTSLYLATFSESETPDPTAFIQDRFLLSDHVTEFDVEFDEFTITEPAPAPVNPADPTLAPIVKKAIRNPMHIYMSYTLKNFNVQREFEIKSLCRNKLENVIVTKNGTTDTYIVTIR